MPIFKHEEFLEETPMPDGKIRSRLVYIRTDQETGEQTFTAVFNRVSKKIMQGQVVGVSEQASTVIEIEMSKDKPLLAKLQECFVKHNAACQARNKELREQEEKELTTPKIQVAR